MIKWPFKILLKYASRGRADRFFEGMETIYNLCSQPDYIRVLVTADEDDAAMNNDFVKNRLATYKNCHVVYGESKNKIHACNRDFDVMPEDWKDWDIVANFSDDMRWDIFGWDDLIRTDFNSVFPGALDGYMAYRDADTNGALSTLYIAGRPWYDRFGWIYDPQFISLFCDNLVEDCAKKLGKYHYTGYTIYRHLNPSYGHLSKDEMYEEQQRIGWDVDQKLYYEIVGKGVENYLTQFNL